jgi:glucose dehydrogenase
MKRLIISAVVVLCALYQMARRSWLVRRGKSFYYIKLT